MDNKHNIALFIFRRDLRLEDNTALIAALENSKQVICAFIFDPQQCTDKNSFKSDNALQFMIESLQEIDAELQKRKSKLYTFYGYTHEVIEQLVLEQKIEAVFINRDYTPFSLKRDESIEHLCAKHNVKLEQFEDELLIDPTHFMTGNGDPYSIFTPFFKKASLLRIPEPIENKYKNFYDKDIKSECTFPFVVSVCAANVSNHNGNNKNMWVHGGRKNAQKILASLKDFKDYEHIRDYPSLSTTNLSPYLKFGVCSPREVYHAIVKELTIYHPLIRSLFWRDFFTYTAYHSPFVFGHAFKEKYDKIPWENDKKKFNLWCTGNTGFPIVDAGMRQLNETGFMHNRVRMITASFLIKDLHIDWQWGEKYFAQKLVDYDPAVNNGNWQWVASTGCDSTPYFRIFNPWLQQKKFDVECTYIKTWVDELKDIPAKIIHKAYENDITGYPKPICDHKVEAAITLKMYKKT
ncbi:MAG: deoxyribodipyrimidine photo-lyase [Candidatus Babeliales bacterium]|nr:deoxyribodipyrimidine photo-lyase [Candidatus Babeliales bacterium]